MSQSGEIDLPILHVGCAMWANRDWVGPYFPPNTPVGAELEAYQTWFNAVEGNTTFYASPPPASVRRWLDQSDENFRFCFKLPRNITHEHKLRGAQDKVSAFLTSIEPLGARVAPIQIQLPAAFGPEDLPVLDAFLSGLTEEFEWATEVRHREFFVGGASERPLDDLLSNWGTNRVILDSRALFDKPAVTPVEIETWKSKPRLPVRPVATSAQPIVRLIGQTDLGANIKHWLPWVAKVADWVQAGLRPFVFIHTPDNRQSPELARRFWDLVAEAVPTLVAAPVPRVGDKQMDLGLS